MMARSTDENAEDEEDEYMLALVRESNAMTCFWSLAKIWALRGNITDVPNALHYSSRHQLSLSQQIRVAAAITLAKALRFLSAPLALISALSGSGRKGNNDSTSTKPRPDLDLVGFDRDGGEGQRVEAFELGSEDAAKRMANLCVMASKLSYESDDVIQTTVEKSWKMRFVRFFDCWNEYLQANATQAYVFTDKAETDANAVVVAFRGTEVLNLDDWSTDVDISYYRIPGIGRVHVGFMEALGMGTRVELQTLRRARDNAARKATLATEGAATTGADASRFGPTSGLSADILNDNAKLQAYDVITEEVERIMKASPAAKLFVTGHSLGGALAALFVALRMYENGGDHSRIGGVFTFGMPRTGDDAFAGYVEDKLCGPHDTRKFFRVVFRTDIVARIPPDDSVFEFRHISPCFYYPSLSSQSQVRTVQPQNNLLSAILQPLPHLSAATELWRIFRRNAGVGEILVRFLAMAFPSICSHFLIYYTEAVNSAPSAFLTGMPEENGRRSSSSSDGHG